MKEKLFDLRQAARDEVRKAIAEILPGAAGGDLISRQAAIAEIMEDIKDRSLHDDPATPEDYAEGYDEGIRNAAAIVLQMPSAQPERDDCDTCKHGYFGSVECNNCRVRYPSHWESREGGQDNG